MAAKLQTFRIGTSEPAMEASRRSCCDRQWEKLFRIPPMKFQLYVFLLCFLITRPASHAQRITVGAIGGTHLTNHVPVAEYANPADAFGNPPDYFRFRSGGRSPILGALLETRLTGLFSLEADVLHRPMRSEITFTEFLPDNANRTSINEQAAVRAWQFPLLLKLHLPVAGRFRPFLAAGPSFRTQEDAGASEPSQVGMTAGAGAALRFGHLRISPTLRCTRWAIENVYAKYATKPDQVEFLTSFGIAGGSELRRLGTRRIEVRAIASFGSVRK